MGKTTKEGKKEQITEMVRHVDLFTESMKMA